MALAKKAMTQFAVIGMGRFGSALTKTLYLQGNDVLAVDIDPDKVNMIAEHATHAAIADGSDEQALKALGIANFDAVIICMGGNMQGSILATLVCKELGVPFLICKANNEKHKTVLTKVGGDFIVVPEEDMAKKVAVQLTNPHINDMMELSKNFHIAEAEVPSSWKGKTLVDLDFRKKYNVIVLLVKRGEEVIVNPEANFVLEIGDNVIIGGATEKLQRFIDKLADA